MTIEAALYVAITIIIIQAAFNISLWRRWKARRKNYMQALAAVETLRIIHFESETSKVGKGIVPRKIWDGIKTVVALTSHLDTQNIVINRKKRKKGGTHAHR